MGFTNCPLEVIEMIIGKVCFVDLLYLLRTSRTIRVYPLPFLLIGPERVRRE
jgi:hypothetical protein